MRNQAQEKTLENENALLIIESAVVLLGLIIVALLGSGLFSALR